MTKTEVAKLARIPSVKRMIEAQGDKQYQHLTWELVLPDDPRFETKRPVVVLRRQDRIVDFVAISVVEAESLLEQEKAA